MRGLNQKGKLKPNKYQTPPPSRKKKREKNEEEKKKSAQKQDSVEFICDEYEQLQITSSSTIRKNTMMLKK